MGKLPLVSILIPVFNRERLVIDALESALSQTYPNYEVVIVDNYSTDRTFDVIQKYAREDSRVRAFRNKQNIGPVRNWAKCLEYANGDYVKILFSDDLMGSSFIGKTLPYLLHSDNVAFVCTAVEIFRNDSQKWSRAHYYFGANGIFDTSEFIERVLLGGEVSVSASHALFRKSDLEKAIVVDIPNKIHSNFAQHGIGADALMFLMTAKNYPRFYYVNEVLAFYRAHDTSITISTPTSKLLLLHLLARAYFVENYLENIDLKKKFNSTILVNLIKYRSKSKLGLKSVKDFYLHANNKGMDYGYFFHLAKTAIFPVLIGRIKRLIQRLGKISGSQRPYVA